MMVAAMAAATPRTTWIPTAIFGTATLLLLAAGTAGSAQLLAAEPPCGPGDFCFYQPISTFLFAGAFIVAAGLASGATVASLGSRLGAAVLGAVALVPIAIVLLALARSGIYPVPLWTIAGPALVVLGLLAVIPPRVLLTLAAIVACAGVATVIVLAVLSPPPGPVSTQQQIKDNGAPQQRRDPRPADAAALKPAAGDLDRALQDLHARHISDAASTRQALLAYPTLQTARVHPPTDEKLVDPDTTVVVVLEHGSACLIGELGPPDESVQVVGLTLDGGCEALYGH
jgi:hypothetical protein